MRWRSVGRGGGVEVGMDKQKLRRLLVGDFSFRRCVRSLVLVYVVVAAYVYGVSNGMIFAARPSSYADSAEMLKIPVRGGGAVTALHLVDTNAHFTVLYSHGNAEDLGELRPYLEDYHARGFSVMAYDYQGYGTSGGRPTEAHTYRDIEAVYAYLVEDLRIPAARILAHGRSVGSGPSTYLASRKPLGGLILESPFTSAFRVVLPFRIFPFDRFPNLRRMGRVRCPVLVIHGAADTTIPIWHGKALYEAASEPKQCRWVDGADHNDLVWAGEAYWGAVTEFRDTNSGR
jgi:fermentation-respiration switch protein FrsA (DUF1100 family)